jgi:hypothetical protein
MFGPAYLLGGILLPALIAGGLLALAWRAWRAEEQMRATWAGAPAVALAFLAGFCVVEGPGALPSEGRTLGALDLIFWAVALLAAVLLLEARVARQRRSRVLLSWALAGLFLIRVVSSSSEVTQPIAVAILLAWLLLVWCTECLASERDGAQSPLALWTSASGFAGVAALSGSVKLGQLGGVLAAALGAAIVLAWWRPRVSLSGGAATLAAFALSALILDAHYFSYTTGVDALLCSASLATPLAARLPGLRRASGARRTALVVVLAALPVAIALTRAALAFEPDPYAGY